jgi:hypothetical protein
MQEIAKLIKIGQTNSVGIKNIMDRQERLEKKFDEKIGEQNAQILEILTLLKDHEPEIGQKKKGRSKTKKVDEFYQVNINWLFYFFTIYSLIIN